MRVVTRLQRAACLCIFLFSCATASAATIPSELLHEYPVPDMAQSLATGQEGSVWFVLGRNIGHLDRAGVFQEFTIPTGKAANMPEEANPEDLTLGPDGNVWFTDWGENNSAEHLVGRITPAGKVTEYPIKGAFGDTELSEIASGSDAVWFVSTVNSEPPEEYEIAPVEVVLCEVLMNGHIHEIKTLVEDEQPLVVGGVALDTLGNVWFSYEELVFEEPFADGLGRYLPGAGGKVDLYEVEPVETMGPITLGGDGNAWLRYGPGIMRITPSGARLPPTPLPDGVRGHPILAADGALWLGVEDGSLARVDQSGHVETFSKAGFGGFFGGAYFGGALAADGNGGLWYTADAGLMHFSVPSPPVARDTPAVTGNLTEGLTVSASTGSWLNDPVEFAYQWERCGPAGDQCVALIGETTYTHLVAPEDVGNSLRVVVTATNLAGSAQATSSATGVIVAANSIAIQGPQGAVANFLPQPPKAPPDSKPRPLRLKTKLRWEVEYGKRFTRFVALTLRNVPASGIARIRCNGRGCPFAERTLHLGAKHPRCHLVKCHRRKLVARNVYDITKLLEHSRLAPGARLTITIVNAGSLGKVFRVMTRSNREPAETIRCLAPGSLSKTVPCT